jgi:hypothetical protein
VRVEIVAALTATGLGVSGTAWIGYLQSNGEARESIVRLSTVAEAISEQLGHMRTEMKKDREVVREMMVDHNARLRVLESRR